VQKELETELKRVADAKRAGEAAERHATDVRRQVQREAKRVAELAAAAVLAAAASPEDDTYAGDSDQDPAAGGQHAPTRAGRPARRPGERATTPGGNARQGHRVGQGDRSAGGQPGRCGRRLAMTADESRAADSSRRRRPTSRVPNGAGRRPTRPSPASARAISAARDRR
jgi:hypothetical protein